jgi:peptidoglycan/LPS O-acetylase OafA/YrhL
MAIGAVILFHAENRLFPGGALGVDAFFLLSAYLITSLLYRERSSSGRVDLVAFYLRRFFRLMPALLLFTFLVGLPLAIAREDAHLGSTVVMTLLYVSDFGRAGVFLPSVAEPFGHTWSLAVEEQFYVVWPSLLLLLYRRTALTVTATGALVALGSAVGVYYLSQSTLGVGQTYFLPTGHLVPLVGGCLLALALRGNGSATLRSVARRPATLPAGVVGFGLLVVLQRSGAPELGPVFAVLATLAVGAVIAAGELRPSVPGWLTSRPLLWLGQRSYGLYLYHTALILLFAAPLVEVRHALAVPLWLGTAIVVTELSYQLVERPVLIRGRGWLSRTRKRPAPAQ